MKVGTYLENCDHILKDATLELIKWMCDAQNLKVHGIM